ncbi:MAG: hypothetical protein ACI3Z5_01635 [Paludibacteraceae bacterium]
MVWIETILTVLLLIVIVALTNLRRKDTGKKRSFRSDDDGTAQRYDSTDNTKANYNEPTAFLPEEGGSVYTQVKKTHPQPKVQPVAAAVEVEQDETDDTPMIDFSDAEEAKKAIIASEILSKKY